MRTLKEYLGAPEGVTQRWNDIHEILDSIDFEKIYRAMKALDWVWACDEKKANELEENGRNVTWTGYDDWYEYSPEVKDIEREAMKLINVAIDAAAEYQEETGTYDRLDYTSQTGGFIVNVYIFNDKERAEIFGEDAPDDFEHSVDVTLKFVIEENMSKAM